MSNFVRIEFNLFDPITMQLVGFVDLNGVEHRTSADGMVTSFDTIDGNPTDNPALAEALANKASATDVETLAGVVNGLGGGANRGPVADQAAMLALTAAVKGDKVTRTDLGQVAELTALPATTLGNWLIYPVAAPGVGGGLTPTNFAAAIPLDLTGGRELGLHVMSGDLVLTVATGPVLNGNANFSLQFGTGTLDYSAFAFRGPDTPDGTGTYDLTAYYRNAGTKPYLFCSRAEVVGGAPALPGQVTGLTLGTATSSSQPLSWAAPSGSPTDYTVRYRVAGASTWATFADGVSAGTTANVTGLMPATSYEYDVGGVNASGSGAFSETATGSTAAGASPPASNPANDNLNRADGLIGTASGGAVYAKSHASGVHMEIVGNKVGQGGGSGVQGSVANTGLTDRTMAFDFVTPSSSSKSMSAILNYVDEDNWVRLAHRADGEWYISAITSGSDGEIGTSTGQTGVTTPQSTAVNAISAVIEGNDYSVSVNGVLAVSATTAAATGGTRSGVFLYTDFTGQCQDAVDNLAYAAL